MRKKIFLIESSENSICPICGHSLKPRDHVNRIMKSSGNIVRWLCIRRLVCTNQSCHSMHRELPDILAPYKHFEADIITGVLDHLITPETKGFEDHPSESTMQQWRHWFMLNRDTMEGTLRSKGYQLLGFTAELLTSSVSLLGRLRKDTCDWPFTGEPVIGKYEIFCTYAVIMISGSHGHSNMLLHSFMIFLVGGIIVTDKNVLNPN